MEAPYPPITVDRSIADDNFIASFPESRPGPVFGFGEGVFQPAFSGKYTSSKTIPLPHRPSISSNQSFAALKTKSFASPGRSLESIMEVLYPSDAVEPAATQHLQNHRPGPAVGFGVEGFQPLLSGKYIGATDHSPPDGLLPFRLAPHTDHTFQELQVYYQNVRGLRTKIDDFFLSAVDTEYDVIVLTETWLDDRINSVQLFGSSFTVFRNDRNRLNSLKSRGGGVLIAVSSRFNCCLDPSPVCTALEQLWVLIKLQTRSISIGVIYLPPDRKSDVSCVQSHVDSIASVVSRLNGQDFAFVFGDYNQSGLQWKSTRNGSLIVDPQRSQMSAACCTLIDGMSLHGMAQVNPVTNSNFRLLDLVLANDAALPKCSIVEAAEPLIPLDVAHPALEAIINLSLPIVFEVPPDMPCLDFRRADYEALSRALSQIDWRFLDSVSCINDAVEYFCNTMNSLFTDCIPARRPPRKPLWSNARSRQLKRLRSSALRRYCNNRSTYSKLMFNRASNSYRIYNRFLYKRYVLKMQDNLRRHPKRFWSFVNSKRNEDGLPSSMYLDESTGCTVPEKCNLFATHFKQAFSNITASPAQVADALRDTPINVFDCNFTIISEEIVANAIRKLKNSFTAGPDGIPSSILKTCSELLLSPLTKLFNISLQQRVFPSRWKFSYMFPVFKKGDKCNIANYRGITSLSACSKVFEIIINDTLFNSCKNYISTDQHGFFPKRSVSTNLVQFVSLCKRSMDSGLQVDAVYTDLKAAFDRVNHAILLSRLAKLGVSSALVDWFRSYLTNRILCVKIGASQSETLSNPSGVPQGSNLGPLLFSLYINEISFLLPPGCRLFYADDVKIFRVIRSILDCLDLQCKLHTFGEWCNRNFLTLSIEKCNVISFHRKQQPFVYEYSLSGASLERVDQIKDLGVILDREMTLRPHYSATLAKANRQLGFIFKIANEFRDPLCLRSLYCSLVRSILETGSVVWCPYQATWIARIESVQKKFVRYALRSLPWRDRMNLPPYQARCRLLGIETLERRRNVTQAVFVAKLLVGEIDSPELLADMNIYAPIRPLRQRNFLQLELRNGEYGMHDPIRFMSSRFNEAFELFDFNISNDVFRQRLLNS